MNIDGNVVWVIGVLLNKTKKNDHRIRARKNKKERQQQQLTRRGEKQEQLERERWI